MQIDAILNQFIDCLPDYACYQKQTLEPSLWTWRDALFQSAWGVYILPTGQQKLNIMLMAHKLMQIKKMYPTNELKIHSWFRFRIYNEAIGGAKNSYHCEGKAVDFSIIGVSCAQVRHDLEPFLTKLNIRMERLRTDQDWVHIDIGEPKSGVRYFLP